VDISRGFPEMPGMMSNWAAADQEVLIRDFVPPEGDLLPMTRDAKQLISDLEAEYDQDEGFLGLLRAGHFDSLARDRFFRLLQSIDLGAHASIDRRVVALLWYVPLFMQWQERRLDTDEREALQAAANRVTSQLERILGVP
jgi:hypothetical protein